MITRTLRLIMPLCWLGMAPVFAQKAIPSQPFVAPVPNAAQWVVPYTYPADRGQAEPDTPDSAVKARMKTVTYEYAGATYHFTTLQAGGRKTENWQKGDP